MTAMMCRAGSPLAEGRELKYDARQHLACRNQSPLAEGRELKFRQNAVILVRRRSPLAEGRELKFIVAVRELAPRMVAPRGGA